MSDLFAGLLSGLDFFHFLRPWWLALIPAALILWWRIRSRAVQRAQPPAGLASVYDRIDEMAPREVETLSFRPRKPLGHWPLAAAAVLALAAVGWLHLRSMRRAAS